MIVVERKSSLFGLARARFDHRVLSAPTSLPASLIRQLQLLTCFPPKPEAKTLIERSVGTQCTVHGIRPSSTRVHVVRRLRDLVRSVQHSSAIMSLKTTIEYPVGTQLAHCTIEVPLSAICETGSHDQKQERIANLVSKLTASIHRTIQENTNSVVPTKRAYEDVAESERPSKMKRHDSANPDTRTDVEEQEGTITPGVPKDIATASQPQQDGHVSFTLRDYVRDIHLRMNRKARVYKALEQFATMIGKPVTILRLIYDGNRVREYETPESVSFLRGLERGA